MSNLQPVRDLDYEEKGMTDDLEVIQLVGLKLGDEEYAIDVLKIQEIIRTVEITSVPRTDSFVLGVMNLRGKVIPVIDLRVRFSLEKMDFDKETRIIVVKFETENIGFVVDEVTEVIRINKKMVEPTPPLVGSIGQEYILGICKYQERLIILLDIDSVISDGKPLIDSNLKKSLLGGLAALPSAEQNFSAVADSVEKEFEAKEEVPEPQQEETAAITGDKPAEAAADDGASIDDLIAAELAKREQETDELNAKKKEDSKKKSDVAENTEEAIDDILNDALNQSENNMHTDEGHVEQDELDFLIQQELNKREQETDELNKKKKLNKSESHVSIPPVEDETEKTSVPAAEAEPEEIEELSAPIQEEAAEVKTPKADSNFDIPADLAAEFGLSDILGDEPTQAEPADIKDELYTLPEPVDQEIDEEKLGQGLPDDFSMPEAEDEADEQDSEPVMAVDPDDDMLVAQSIIDELKADSDMKPASEQESFEKLKTLSKKIIDGEKVDLGVSVKKEVAELLRLITDTKGRVDEIEPTIITSKEQLPNVVKSLETVTESTEHATMTLMETADTLTGEYQTFLSEMDDLEDLIYKKDKNAILKKLDNLENSASEADTAGMNILHALEFQDITEQKLNKVIGAMQEVGARLGALLGFIKLKQEQDPATVEDASQSDIDKLLAEFGLN